VCPSENEYLVQVYSKTTVNSMNCQKLPLIHKEISYSLECSDNQLLSGITEVFPLSLSLSLSSNYNIYILQIYISTILHTIFSFVICCLLIKLDRQLIQLTMNLLNVTKYVLLCSVLWWIEKTSKY
jgi:hypothetical protein